MEEREPSHTVGGNENWKTENRATIWSWYRNPLLHTYLEKTIIQRNTGTLMFIAALFTIARTWKQPKCLSTEKCIKKMWYIYIYNGILAISQFSDSVMSDSLWPHGLQHIRLPCPSPTPRAYSNSCPSSQWCYPTISSTVVSFSSCLQSFSASGSFLMSQFFM